MYKRSIFLFRQDLRVEDNTGLSEAIAQSESIFPIFIHDSRAREDFGENDPRFGFIREACEYIDEALKQHGGRLMVYQGEPDMIIGELIKQHEIDALFLNKSYSPRGKIRDDAIESMCRTQSVDFHTYQDFLLVEPHEVEQRKVFTPFSMLWKQFLLAHPERLEIQKFNGNQAKWFVPNDRNEIGEIITVPYHPYWTLSLGNDRMERDFTHYDEQRNLPAVDGSTRLSPYIRFGIFSVRQVYAKFFPVILGETKDSEKQEHGFFLHQNDGALGLGHSQVLLNELIWREFWYHIAYYFPYTYALEFQERRRAIEWNRDESSYEWQRFQVGKTGYPLIDAAVRQLIETNWMHNRLRMVVASFLTKNLGIDWRIGERWFKKYLIDYDEAVNFGNWQWSASVGADPKPVRIFNPLLQSEKFDTDARLSKNISLNL